MLNISNSSVRPAFFALIALAFVAIVALVGSHSKATALIQFEGETEFLDDLRRLKQRESARAAFMAHLGSNQAQAPRGRRPSMLPPVLPPNGGLPEVTGSEEDDDEDYLLPTSFPTSPDSEPTKPPGANDVAPEEPAAKEEEKPEASEDAPPEPAEKEEEETTPSQPALLGDEVIDLPKMSSTTPENDYGDLYVSAKNVEKNRYWFKQRRPASAMLYNSPDPFDGDSHKPPCKYQCQQDPWGPGCDGHAALSNGDCEETIQFGWDRTMPVDKISPATYDAYSGNSNGLFKAQRQQNLLAKQGKGTKARQSGLWLGDNWYIEGLPPAPENVQGQYGNSLFDFGPADGTPVSPDSGLPAPGMTEFWSPGDGETHPGLFDVDGIRRNEDGGLDRSWYAMNEPQGNFWRGGKGKWAPGRSPSVMVMDGHVEFIDDGMRMGIA